MIVNYFSYKSTCVSCISPTCATQRQNKMKRKSIEKKVYICLRQFHQETHRQTHTETYKDTHTKRRQHYLNFLLLDDSNRIVLATLTLCSVCNLSQTIEISRSSNARWPTLSLISLACSISKYRWQA